MTKPLSACRLFRDVEPERIRPLLEEAGARTRTPAKGDVIAPQGARHTQLLILTEGTVSAETTDSLHNTLHVERIAAPSLIAPLCLFAENDRLPAGLTARTPATILALGRDAFTDLLGRERALLVNFLEILSAPNTFLSERVVYRTYKTMKGKFANYLLNLMEEQEGCELNNALTQREMADMFGVTRPALARAIGEMAAEGSIYVQGKRITVLFPEKLKQYAKN